jgi:hypothetical protein
MATTPLTATGHANVDRRFLDSFELQAPIESRPGAFIAHGRLSIRFLEQLLHDALRCALTDDHKIPWLHEPNRPGVMGCSQYPRKNIVGNRHPQKIPADIPPLENHSVDGRPLMVGKLSGTWNQNVALQTHTKLPEQMLAMTVMGNASLGSCRAHRLDRKCLECTGTDHLQAGRTEAILKSSSNPVHLLFCNPNFPAPAAVLTAFKGLLALLARFGDRSSHR